MALFSKKKTKSSNTAPVRPEPKKTGLVNAGALLGIISAPHITEKASQLAEKSQYVFKVDRRANKSSIAQAISRVYQVKVEKVNILCMPSKQRRVGRQQGKRPGFKKAIVILKSGQKIDLQS